MRDKAAADASSRSASSCTLSLNAQHDAPITHSHTQTHTLCPFPRIFHSRS
jgi:hypothetical protein